MRERILVAILSLLPPLLPTLALAGPWDDSRIPDELGASRDGLETWTYRRMTGDQLGWMDMNPYALYDLGYINSMDADLGKVWEKMIPLMLSTYGNSEQVRVYFRRREGRAKPLSPHFMRTHHSRELTVTRMLQKGGFATGNAGGHKDGLLDLPEAYGDMMWGELFHQNGLFSTRGLLAVQQKGVRRNLPGGPGLDAGLTVRFMEYPRLREPGGWTGNYQDAMLETIKYEHPLIISGIDTLDPRVLNWFLALHNEAMLKDLWVLHGSYTFDENRSASLIDFGTTSALYEPNPNATLGFTSYDAEIQESANLAAQRMGDDGRDIPKALREVQVRGKMLFNHVYWSTYAFMQLKRLGLSEGQILSQFTRETVPNTNFQFHFASDAAIEFAKAIHEIDKQTMHSYDTFSVDFDDGKSARINQRVLVNTRKLMRNILESRLYQSKQPSDAQIRELVTKSFFGTHGGKAGPQSIMGLLDKDPGKRDYIFKKVREIIDYAEFHLRPKIDISFNETLAMAKSFPVDQNLPSRREAVNLAWKWATTPGSFGKEFVKWVEARTATSGEFAERRKAHLRSRSEVPLAPPISALKNFVGECRDLKKVSYLAK